MSRFMLMNMQHYDYVGSDFKSPKKVHISSVCT